MRQQTRDEAAFQCVRSSEAPVVAFHEHQSATSRRRVFQLCSNVVALVKVIIKNGYLLRSIVSWRAKLAYVGWQLGLFGRRKQQFVLGGGETLLLRRWPSNDCYTAIEVFIFQSYKPPEPLKGVKHIVDLGSNVGYSVLYFSRCFPEARIDAFEPHPVHLVQLQSNVSANALEGIVTIYPYAAGREEKKAFLTDRESMSAVVDDPDGGALAINLIDFLAFARGRRIDLLKMDIEGGEYDIVFDPRFQQMGIRYLVLEWHATAERPLADRELGDQLKSLGYRIHQGAESRIPGLRFGVLWALLEGKRA